MDPKALFEKHGAFVQALARGLVADEHTAEDMAHETWVAVVRRPPIGVQNVRAWLSTILQRRVASYRRGVRKSSGLESVGVDSAHRATDEAAQQLEYEHVLHDAVRALGEPCRSTIYLRFHEGLPPRSIAARTGVPVKTVKTRLSRALAKLRTTLDSRFPPDGTSDLDWRRALVPIGGAGLNTLKLGGSTAPLLLGMKKLIVVAAVLLASIAWFVQSRGPTDPMPGPASPAPESVALVEPTTEDGEPQLDLLAAPADPLGMARDAGVEEAASDASSDPAVLLVDVVDASGAPIPGRAVVLQDRPWLRTGAPSLVRRTSPAGRVAFHGLKAAHYFAKDGFGRKYEGFSLEPGETKHLRWAVESDVVVEGKVLDEKGRPKAGADVWIVVSDRPSEPMLWATRAVAGGRFTLRCSSAAALQATAPGRLPTEAQLIQRLPEVEPGVRNVTLSFVADGASLKGRVIDTNGVPIENASVLVEPDSWPMHADAGGMLPRPIRALTGSTGQFEWPSGLPAGEHRTTVRAPGFAATHTTVYIERAPAEVEFVLQRGVDISGTIIHPDGTLAPKAHVWVDRADSTWSTYGSGYGPSTESDEQGRFTLRGVPPGKHSLCAQAAWTEALSRFTGPVEVEQQSIAGLRLALETGRTILGRITDPAGAPIEGLVVTAFGEGTKSNDVATRADGSFALTALPEQESGSDEWDVVVRTWTGTNVRVVVERLAVTPNSGEVTFVVERIQEASATLQGRLVAETSRLPGDLELFLGEEGSRGGGTVPFDPKTGAFSKGPLRPGTYQIRVLRAGVFVTAMSGLVVHADETVDVGVIHLADGGSVELRPELPASQPVEPGSLDTMLGAATASLVGPGGTEVPLEWREGAWRHKGTLEAGTWQIHLDAEQFFLSDRTVQIEPGAHQRAGVVLLSGRRVDVRVQLPPDQDAWTEVKVVIRSGASRVIHDGPLLPRSTLPTPSRWSMQSTVPLGALQIQVITDSEIGATEAVEIVQAGGLPRILQVIAH